MGFIVSKTQLKYIQTYQLYASRGLTGLQETVYEAGINRELTITQQQENSKYKAGVPNYLIMVNRSLFAFSLK